jgi:hypothetical protein
MFQAVQLWGLRCRLSKICAIGLLLIFASAGMTACSYSGAAQASVSSALTQSQVQSSTSVAQSQPSAAVAGKKCGIVQSLGRLEVPVADSDAGPAENCFLQALQQCRPATLVFIMSSIDTSVLRTFSTHNNHGTCSLVDTRQFRVLPGRTSAPVNYTCAGVKKIQGGLLFVACGQDGNVTV